MYSLFLKKVYNSIGNFFKNTYIQHIFKVAGNIGALDFFYLIKKKP